MMVMVCPNCHSHEIISVQGQNFCISCGQIVPDTESEKVLAAVGAQLTETGQAIIKGHAKPAGAGSADLPPAAKKRPVGRPRKARLDTPITHLPPAVPPPPDPALTPGPAPKVAVKTPAELPAAPQIPAKRRVMTDVHRAEAPAPLPKKVHPEHGKAGMAGAAYGALSHGLNYVQALPAALAVLLPVGLAWQNLSVLAGLDLRLPTKTEAAVLAQLVLSLVIFATMVLISLSAVIYGSARRHDNRGGSGLVWARVGAAANRKIWGVLLWQFFITVPTVAALWALIKYGGLNLALPPYIGYAAVFLMSVTAGYILIGVLIAGALGYAGVTLAGIGVWQAVHLGWSGWRQHFELFGNWVGVKLGAAVLAAAWLWSLWPLTGEALSNYSWLLRAAGGLVVLLLILIVQAGAATEASYRHVVSQDRFGQAGNFLMGRSTKHLRKFSAAPLVICLSAAAAIVALQLTILR